MSGRNDAPAVRVVEVRIFGDESQCKRPDQGIWKFQARIYVPCPLSLKNEFSRVSRANSMSQAELGLVIFQNAMEQKEATQNVINEYREAGKQFDRNGRK